MFESALAFLMPGLFYPYSHALIQESRRLTNSSSNIILASFTVFISNLDQDEGPQMKVHRRTEAICTTG